MRSVVTARINEFNAPYTPFDSLDEEQVLNLPPAIRAGDPSTFAYLIDKKGKIVARKPLRNFSSTDLAKLQQ